MWTSFFVTHLSGLGRSKTEGRDGIYLLRASEIRISMMQEAHLISWHDWTPHQPHWH